ncbi:MAG: lysophospholipid acyltransferase family protein [Chloroflexi bacterium]|nr:lysophospholipid acyltransferase family protein [Chloroflexota bacterium]
MIVLYWLWRLGMFLIALTPHRVSFWLAGAMGEAAYYAMPLRRRVAEENFARVLGKPAEDPAVQRVARGAFKNFARQLRDVMIYPSMTAAQLDARVTIVSPAHFETALAPGKGAIVVSAHFGNTDLPSAVMAMRFKPFTLVAESLRPAQLMDYLTKIRAARGVHLFPYDSAPRKILQALKRNEMTAFLLDFGVTHHFDITTVPVTFFGASTDFPAGPAQMALLTGAAIIVGHVFVADDAHMYIHTNEPIVVKAIGERRQVMQMTMQQIARQMEVFIREHPEQWYVFRPMWNMDAKRLEQIKNASLSANKS